MPAMQRSLGFSPITAEAAQLQVQRIAAEAERAVSEAAAAAEARRADEERAALLRPGPGRPKLERSANDVLAAAAAAAAASSSAAAAAATAAVVEEPIRKRGKYCNWFATPLVHDILAAYQVNLQSARKTVEWLRNKFPRLPTESSGRFDDLRESTVRSWHDDNGKLLAKFRDALRGATGASRGPGRPSAFAGHPEIEDEVKRVLRIMREKGAVVNIVVLRLVMRAVILQHEPSLLANQKLSNGFCSQWAHEHMLWSWRQHTTAASKLPNHWRQLGIDMAKRVACFMQLYGVHPSLIVNMDQTGVHLAPADQRTYEQRGSKHVAVVAAEDKRQITACIASSLDGDLLPLQLIFQGKTDACHPPTTDSAKTAKVHVTHSENHWSNQHTMRQWIDSVLMPYAERQIAAYSLPPASKLILVLDVWAVHKSEEFRMFLRTHHPRIHLVFVPANCTSQLQVADVVLQRPFKHGIRRRFTEWAARIIQEQVDSDDILGLSPYLKMSVVKPLILQWCIDSWSALGVEKGRAYVKMGWHTCCVSLFNVLDAAKRAQAVEESARGEIEAAFIPVEEEEHEAEDKPSEDEEDDDKDELDVMKERQYGSRKSDRKRAAPKSFGYQIGSQQIALSEDSS
jgi:hypothetical protein